MYLFRELQKAKKLTIDKQENRLAVLGNTATQFLAQAIEGYAKLSDINLTVFDADYNQIDAQLLDSTSEVFSFNPNEILLWLSTDKLYEEFLDLSVKARGSFAEDYLVKIQRYWNLIGNNSKASILQVNFFEIDDKVLGQFSCKIENTFIYQIRKLNYLLQEAASSNSQVYIVDFSSIQMRLGREKFFDAKLYYGSKMSISVLAMPYAAKAVVDIIKAKSGKIKKCVILDLDNTLWGGVIGDDGIAGIEIGEFGKGHVFSNFQRWLKQLKEYGFILAVCSKNNEGTAKEPFENHEDMILKLSDFTLFVANWNDKGSNIKLIKESLNIGFDSLIFIDDNPFERSLVKEKYPDIEVPELPVDQSLWLDYLQSQNYFETVSYTSEMSDRTKLYQAELERKKLEQTFESIDAYLKGLEMIGAAKPFDEFRYQRIAELSQRSNQFNLRTIRYTEEDIRRIAEDDNYITFYFTLKDKFGDHGLVSVVILKKRADARLFIDTWFMSCRVLKRGMEEFVVNKIVEYAQVAGYEYIDAEYIPTPKNCMVKDIYEEMGFKRVEENSFELKTNEYKKQNTFIKEDV